MDQPALRPSNPVPRWAALLIPAACVLVVDQITKAFILRDLQIGDLVTPIPALSDFFAITSSRNTGAAFSMLPKFGDIFLLVALLLAGGILIFYRRTPSGHWAERIALGLVLGGAMGNALDRLEHGYVVDWVLLRLPGVISNVSNLADHAIVIGIGVLFITQFLGGKPAPLPPDDSPPSDQPSETV